MPKPLRGPHRGGDAGRSMSRPLWSSGRRRSRPTAAAVPMVLSSRSPWSLLSWRSVGSVLSASSFGSVLSAASILSAGSFLSIGSAGSVLSIGSTGSVLSIGSSGSILSIGAAGAVRGRRNGGGPDPATVGTVLALLALLRSAAAR
jgi:hypothetical protein